MDAVNMSKQLQEQQLAEIMAIRAMLHAYILTTLNEVQIAKFTDLVNKATLTVKKDG